MLAKIAVRSITVEVIICAYSRCFNDETYESCSIGGTKIHGE